MENNKHNIADTYFDAVITMIGKAYGKYRTKLVFSYDDTNVILKTLNTKFDYKSFFNEFSADFKYTRNEDSNEISYVFPVEELDKVINVQEINTSSATPGYMTPGAWSANKADKQRRNKAAADALGWELIPSSDDEWNVDANLVMGESKKMNEAKISKKLEKYTDDMVHFLRTKVFAGEELGKYGVDIYYKIKGGFFTAECQRTVWLPAKSKEGARMEYNKKLYYIDFLFNFATMEYKIDYVGPELLKDKEARDKMKKEIESAGFKLTSGQWTEGDVLVDKIKKAEPAKPKVAEGKLKVETLMSETNPTLTENRYIALKNDETRGPKQKVHDGLKNIRTALNEIETNLHFLSKYKTEIGLPADNYYKRTKANLAKISEKINTINAKLKNLY